MLVIDRHIAAQPLEHYGGLVTMHALVHLAKVSGDTEIKEKSIIPLEPFFSGRVNEVNGVYDRMYRSGACGSALLVKYGYVPEITAFLVAKAEELIRTHPRHPSGAFGQTEAPEKVWIDSVFAVCPFLAILGNVTGRGDFIDESVKNLLKTF
jgi:rhamnogalacturonyl hydrolase YesR